MATYIVNGDRYDSIVSARASAVRRAGRRPVGETIPIYKGTALEGVVFRTENGYSYKVGRRTFQINTDGTIRQTPAAAKPKATPRRASASVDLKRLEDDLVEFQCRHMDLASPWEYGSREAVRKSTHFHLSDEKYALPHSLWDFATCLRLDEYPKVSYAGFTDERIKRMLTDLRTVIHKRDNDKWHLDEVDEDYKLIMSRISASNRRA